MARGRAPGFENQREEILDAAARLFAHKGYAGTSMNAVAEACEVSKPTLYHYVKDKQELLAQICETHVLGLAELVKDVQALQLAGEPHLRALIARFVQSYGQAQNQHRVLTEDVKFLSEEDQQRLLKVEREVVNAFAEAVAAVRPELKQEKLHKPLTMLLFGMINWTFTWLKPDGDLSYEDMAPMVADLFFGGLGAVSAPAASPVKD
ncbi:TetR/AcrR family transcriptional regulator [Paucibacter sp. KCTC 42545]|uniref:TetR/AcrR family transcriptional regulator n=1 Tax=Paucibacter sp. KCTC 42545 TaxID=1768242 RepID=UPI000733B071|nr:TetR/AcrR family transcriptional regulator [Paucibacter sp. KCTC 42545]ALT77784.1 TetR family transcriptional regulator [Paucibacter sp. KCTC 42545]